MASSHKFILVESSLGENTNYRAVPQLVKILDADQCYLLAETASSSGTKVAEYKSFDNALASVIKKYLSQGVAVVAEDAFGVNIGVKGGFASASGPWVKGVNYLQPSAYSKGALKLYPMNHIAVCLPVNEEGELNPQITSIYDPTSGLYDVIKDTNTFTITGKNLVPDSSKTDEGVWISVGGVEYKCTITESLNTVVKATPPATITQSGEAVVIVRTRSGGESTTGVAEVTRTCTYVKS